MIPEYSRLHKDFLKAEINLSVSETDSDASCTNASELFRQQNYYL